jgi:hypothetical protein
MSSLYRNPRAWRARIVQAVVWVGLVAIAAIPLTPSAPATTADLFAVSFGVVLAMAAVIGVEFFLRRYVVAIDAVEGGAVFTTLATFGQRRVRHGRNEIRHAGRRHDRAMYPGAPSVDNQWVSLQTTTGQFAYVIDVTPPATIDDAALQRALG